MKKFIRFLLAILLSIVLSMGIGVNVTYMTNSTSLGQVVAVFLIFIITLFICGDFYPNGFKKDNKNKNE